MSEITAKYKTGPDGPKEGDSFQDVDTDKYYVYLGGV
jgi:hypothetical protein